MNSTGPFSNDELKALGNQGYSLALRMLRHREDAADAVQDAMHHLLRKRMSFDAKRGTIKSWFLRIVKNRCIDMQRKSRPMSAGESFDPLDPTEASAQDSSEKNELVSLVRMALNQLPEDAREIVLLRDFHGLSYAEISDVLGISSGTVMSRLHRARERLRERVVHARGAQEPCPVVNK